MRRSVLIFLLICLPIRAVAQQSPGTLEGHIADELGGRVVNATVNVVGTEGFNRTISTDAQGEYRISALAPGKYSVRVTAKGFAPSEASEVEVTAGSRQVLNVKLRVSEIDEGVTVNSEGSLSTASGNAGSLTLRGDDLDILPDDPEDLSAALQSLVGPSVGPEGGQIFIDNILNTGQPLPPRASIREVSINQNPFSAENDRIGFGRIEISTKPGTDKWHSDLTLSFSDESLNSRNPFAENRSPYQSRSYNGNISGPIVKKRASFFLNLSRFEVDDNVLINATVLDAALRPTPLQMSLLAPQRRFYVSPRLDYQLNSNHTLAARYSLFRSTNRNSGVGAFSLPERAYIATNTVQTFQLTETAVINKRFLNDFTVQFSPERQVERGDNSRPTINVLEAFIGGGSYEGFATNPGKRLWLRDNLTWTAGNHTRTFGARVRYTRLSEISSYNFGGTFVFAGGLSPQLDAGNRPVRDAAGQFVLAPITSIERYRRTLLFRQQGLSAAEIRALGGGPTQFSIITGDPLQSVKQTELALFIQDDWRLRPHLIVSLGLRYETQSNIGQTPNFAPRFSFAWSPASSEKRPSTTIIRGGFGLFFERFDENYTLVTSRYNGINQQQFIVNDPQVLDLFPQVTPVATLAASGAYQQTIRRTAEDLRVPYTAQTAISLERRLPRTTTLTASFVGSRTLHAYRLRNVNAPLPGTFVEGDQTSGIRPQAKLGNVLQFESSGHANQSRFVLTLNSRPGNKLTLLVNYVLSKSNSDTDSLGVAPANSYDARSEYGRSSFDVRHYLTLSGTISAPLGFRLSPFIIAASGRPFNIVTGRDSNGDSFFNERPAFADDLMKPDVVVTRLGAFDLNPAPGRRIIPRNFGQGPGFFTVNLNMSRSIRVGHAPRSSGRAKAEKPFSLTFSIRAQNLLNHINAGLPIGNLSSPRFGLSTSLAGGYGGGNPSAGNRRLDAQIRFSF